MTEGYPADVPNIALCGKAGSGKDTVAELLRTRFNLGYQRVALADPLKDIASILWGNEARTDRAKLQGLGVAVREIEADTWVDLLLRNMYRKQQATECVQRFVVTDVRFPNEFRALKAAGFTTIRVDAPRHLRIDRLKRNGKLQDEAQLDHPSETALDGIEFTPDFNLLNDLDETYALKQLTAILKRVTS